MAQQHSAALDFALHTIQAEVGRSGQSVVALTQCVYVPHGIPAAAQSGAIAATARVMIYVSDSNPHEAVRHELDPARQPAIKAPRFSGATLDFGDGRLFILPSKHARAIKTALHRSITRYD